jgi:AcrR family transcriptional regulator
VWADGPPERRGLSRPRIVEAAIATADEHGLGGLTMAAVARRLGSYTAMALYRHVPGKDALTDLMLDAVTAEMSLGATPSGDWRGDLRDIARASWQVVMRHPWYAQLVHTRPPLGPHMLRRTERILKVLTDRGATVGDAMTYAALLDRHVFGAALQAAEERDMELRHGLADPAQLRAAIQLVGERHAREAGCPIVAGWMRDPTVVSPARQLELSLDFLLDGIAGRLASRSARGTARRSRR